MAEVEKNAPVAPGQNGALLTKEEPEGDPHMTLELHASHSGGTLDTGSQDDRDRGLHHLQITRTPSKTIISFRPSDPEHPNNWSTKWKSIVVLGCIMSVINSTLASSLPSGGIGEISTYFKVTNHLQLVLPISTFLIGYFGGILCGPLSEHFGRKPVMIVSFSLYTAFTLGCALAPNWPALLVFRWLCGVMASAPIAVVGGIYADIFSEPRKRGIAMAVFMGATTFGPALGPLASGFIATVSWRWCFWLGLILAGATLPFLFIMPETYVPVLIAKKAAKIRKETGNSNITASSELEKKSVRHILTVVMTRPFRMILHESIVLFTCMYLSLAYGIFYLYFEAYPIIFQGPNSIYHFTPGIAGLAFLPIGIGASICTFIFIWYDSFLVKAQKRNAPWAAVEEYRRLPLACVGGPLYVVGLLWLAWSAKPGVHWIVPILSGIPFGMGFLLIFMAMLNYLTDAYKTFAASAQGIASTTRAIAGALLPFAAKPMFAKLGVDWACSLLAFLSLGMALIPWMFIKFGDRIRANSRFCQHLKKLDEEEAEREEKRQLSERPPSSEKVDEKNAKYVVRLMEDADTPLFFRVRSATVPPLLSLAPSSWFHINPNPGFPPTHFKNPTTRPWALSMQQQYIQEMSPFYPPRTRTQHLTTFTRPLPAAVTYDLSVPDQVTISVPACSTWTSEPHWHETHTEYLQILQGRASIMLAGKTKVYGPDDGVVVVERFAVHEWWRADDKEGELVVREWTEPGDGQKEVFFRMLNSFLMEPRPEKIYRQSGFPLSLGEPWIEKWVVLVQLFVIFRELDNWPVLAGTMRQVDWLNWTITHAVLWFVSWVGRFLGLEARYVEYLGESTIERGDQKPQGERKDK